mgnify:FL=1|jgi:hypothetical protein
MSKTESVIRHGFRYFAGTIALGFGAMAILFINSFIGMPTSYLIPYQIHSMTYSIILIAFMPLSLYAIIKSGKKEMPFRYMLIPFFVGIALYTGFRKYYIDKFNSFDMPNLFDLNIAVLLVIILFVATIFYMKKAKENLRTKEFRLDNTSALVLILVSIILTGALSVNLDYFNKKFNDVTGDDSLNIEEMRSSMAKSFWSGWFRIYSFFGIIVGIVALYENNKENKFKVNS